MTKKKLFFLGLLPMLLGACSDSHLMSPDNQTPIASTSNAVSIEEALHNADLYFSNIYGEATRSTERTAISVEMIHHGTRSSQDADALEGFYVVNYADDNGFAILSADRRLEPVYAISNTGQLHLADTLDNKGLSWYINQAIPVMSNAPLSGNFPGISQPALPTDFWVTIKLPLLNGVLAKFSQGAPYNIYCPLIGNARAKVGCGPLAAGTIMGYYEYPAMVKGRAMNWSGMKSNAADTGWPWLFAALGDSNHMEAAYGLENTVTLSNKVVPTFSKEGYKINGFYAFSVDLQVNELVNNRPTYLVGYTRDNNNQLYSHDWVIDGAYKSIHRIPAEALYPGSDPIETVAYYFHCVWGLGSYGNGYFLYDDSLGGDARTSTGVPTGEVVDVYTTLCLYTGIEPNN